MPPIAAQSGPQPIAATINGSGARYINSNEISAPDMIEANISADAQPAASPMSTVPIISCPAPFERLEEGRKIPPHPQLVSLFVVGTVSVSVSDTCPKRSRRPLGPPSTHLDDTEGIINAQNDGLRR